MITNFELITKDLTREEMSFVEPLIELLKKYSKENPIKAPSILKHFNGKKDLFSLDDKFSGARLRKLINAIRSNAVAPIIATSSGYYLSEDRTEIEKQIISLEERAFAILNASNGLKAYAVEKFGTEIFSA